MGEKNARVQSGAVTDTIRDAATVIVVRDPVGAPCILMGQRGAGAVFMPDKFVFPGGAVDPSDRAVALASALSAGCRKRLSMDAGGAAPEAIAVAAIRELFEESGQMLAAPGASPPWRNWADDHGPDAAPLRFFMRAVTPPGRPRRYDARFFLVDASRLHGDHKDFDGADGELRHLRWVPLAEALQLDLALITRIALTELDRHLPRMDAPDRVPFIRNDDAERGLIWL